MAQNKLEVVQETAKIQCAECGQWMKNEVETYLMECDRCLAKRDE